MARTGHIQLRIRSDDGVRISVGNGATLELIQSNGQAAFQPRLTDNYLSGRDGDTNLKFKLATVERIVSAEIVHFESAGGSHISFAQFSPNGAFADNFIGSLLPQSINTPALGGVQFVSVQAQPPTITVNSLEISIQRIRPLQPP